MSTVILFGGGDAGGLVITAKGVRPIPPFDPGVRLQLRGVAAIIHALDRIPDREIQRKLAPLIQNTTNLVMEQIEQILGPLKGDHALVYQDDDGGFTCGSTGKPPIPIPWPPSPIPSINDLVAHGLVDADLLELLHAAKEKDLKLTEVFESPATVAKKLGVKLSKKAEQDLQLLSPSRVGEIKDVTDREIVQFFHKVIEDGRHINSWATRPFEVSKELGVQLSEQARDKIIAGGASSIFHWSNAAFVPAIAVGVAIVVMLYTSPAEIIKDRSGVVKF
jgi:hypothetical protein